MKRILVGVSGVGLLLGVVAGQPVSASVNLQPAAAAAPRAVAAKPGKKASSKKGRLIVRLDKPKALPVRVIVKGGGTKRVLRRTAALKGLKPGKYTVTAANKRIRTKQGTYFASFKRRTVKIAPKSRHTVALIYGFRPDSTKVKSPNQITVLGGDIAGRATVKVKGRVKRGDVIVSAPSASFPDGVLVKVTSVTKGQAITSPATLTDAIPAGTFTQSLSGSATVDEGAALAAIPGADKSPFWKKIKCNTSGDASLTGAAEATITATMDSGWGKWLKPWLEIRGAASAGADLTLEVAGEGQCTLARTALLANPIVLPRVQFSLYGVPVWLNNSLQFYLEGSAQATASIASSAGVSVSTDAGVRIGYEQRTWFNPPTVEKTFTPPTLRGTANGTIWIGADVQSLVYGQVGGALGVDVGPQLVVDSAARPWWTLSLQARGTGRLTSNIPGLKGEHRFPEIGRFSQVIADSGLSGPDQSGDTTTPGAVRRITSYTSTGDVRCALFTAEDNDGEFYGEEGNACGTFLSVDGRLFGPQDIPARSDFGEYWVPVSQTTTGIGSAQDPFVTTTVVRAGDTGLFVEQEDKWALNSDIVRTRMRVRNTSGSAKVVRLTRAADCYVGDDDVGTGELSVSGGYAGCLRPSSAGMITLRLQALGNSPTVVEAFFDDVWDLVNAQQDLPNTCRCTEEIDNGVAVSWLVTIPAGSSTVRASEFSLRRV